MNRIMPALSVNETTIGEADAPPPVLAGGLSGGVQPPLLVEYWRTIDRWKWVIVAVLTGAMLLGLIFTLLATPLYTATGRLQVDREEKRVTSVESLTPESAGRDLEFYETQYALLRARSLAERVARELRLASDSEFNEVFGLMSEESEGESQILARGEQDDAVALAADVLLQNVTISPVRDSRLIDVSFTSSSALLSARIANAWMTVYQAESIDRRFDSTADARRFLESRLAELRERLEDSERQFVNYARDADIVALSSTTDQEGRTRVDRTLVGESLTALNSELAKATAERIAAQSALGRLGASGPNGYNPTLAALREQRAELAAQHARLMVQFEPAYPAARQVQSQIDALDASMRAEENRSRGDLQDAFRSASQREEALRNRVQQLQGQLSSQQTAGIRYNILQREVDTNRQLYDTFLQRYKEIGVAGVGVSNISVVDAAEIPQSPSSPRLIVNLLAALLLGIAISGATVYILEQSDEGIKDPSQVRSRLGIPLLGSIPKIDQLPQEEIGDPKSDFFEAFITVRTNLAFSTDHGIPRSIMLSSTRPAEGKSTSAMALAVVISRLGRKVALIDGDMRSPSIAGYFDVEEKEGLANYLSGNEDWRGMMRPTSFEGLQVLTTGPTPPSASELLASDRMANLVSSMLQEYDHVIIDAPPVLAMADAPLLAHCAEGCIFVVESEETSIRGINTALQRIRASDVPVIGAILTMIDVRTAGYGYGYGTRYGYGYGYGYNTDEDDADSRTSQGRA
jgi:succinoglycan biosynthesis transport protein ExoP